MTRLSRRKVYVNLMGGVGNQLFIYFAGLFLTHKCKAELFLVKNLLEDTNASHPGRNIQDLGLSGRFISNRSLIFKYRFKILNLFARKFDSASDLILNKTKYFISNQVGFDRQFYELSSPLHVHGYFQTWKYAENFLDDFKVTLEQYRASSRVGLELIQESNLKLPIVIHIRLGDYLDQINDKFGVMGVEYYRRALSFVLQMAEFAEREIWIYSDSIKVAKALYASNLPAKSKWIDEFSELDNLDTFIAMRNASVHIIGNSSFSWWAAYSSSTTQLVVAPSKWFKDMVDPLELLPNDWVKIDSSWEENNA